MPTGGVDYNTRTKEQLIELIEMIQRDRYKLEEENQNLKNEIIGYMKIESKLNNVIKTLKEENKKLKSDLSLVIKERDDNIKQNKKLSEENGQLKSDLAFKNTMLDNVSAEYESSQDVIKKLKAERDMHRDAAKDCGYDIKELKERIRFLEQCLDNKEKVNKSLREELQRYKDMWDSGEF